MAQELDAECLADIAEKLCITAEDVELGRNAALSANKLRTMADFIKEQWCGNQKETLFQQSPLDLAARDVLNEVVRAKSMWPRDFASAHEGYAVILEEMDELRAHVWTNQKRRDLVAMRKEAVQLAAMVLRFISELCNEETGRK